MSIVPPPLPQYYPRHQEDLYWYKYEADGALGRKSLQGAIQARLEGASGSFEEFDLEDNQGLYMAVQEVTNRASFHAAGRIKRIERAFAHVKDMDGWKHTSCSPQNVLSAVYWTAPQQGMEAFEAFANLVVFSPVALQRYEKVKLKSKMTFVEWVMILSQRRLGFYNQVTKQRGHPKATNAEVALCIQILHECKILLKDALWQYVKADRDIREKKRKEMDRNGTR